MKKITLLLSILFFTSAIIFTSCNKGDEATVEGSHENFTPEQHKESLSTTSTDAITQLEAIQNSKTTDAGESIVSLLENSNLKTAEGQKIQELMQSINEFLNNPAKKDELLKSLKSDENRFVYADFAGIYEWNPSTQDWDKSSSSKIIFKFPATENGTSNNAVLTFESYTDQAVTVDIDIFYLPKSASLNLTVDGNKELEFTYNASYKTNGIPESIRATLFVNPYTFATSFKNTNTKVSEDYSWVEGNENILAFGVTFNGDFSSISYDMEDENFGNLISTATTYAQLYDARLEITANVTEIAKFDEPTTEQINANSTILLKWANDNVKIADGAFYEKDNEDIAIMLTFEDGSTADAEVYFETMINQFEKFFEDLEKDLDS